MSAPLELDTALERALKRAEQGFYVFPSWRKDRHIAGWPTRATRDADIIRAWFTGKYSDCWPSIFTGKFGDGSQSLVVVDVDPRGVSALESGALDSILPKTRTHRTPRKGLHGFYVAPFPGVKSGTNVLADGIDIRSKAGLVHFGEGYTIEQDKPIAQAPASLIAKCGDLAPATAPADRAQDRISPDQEAALQNAEKILGAWPKVAEGDRNTALRDFIYRVRENCATDADSTLTIGLSFAAEICEPSYPEDEARATIRSAIKSAQNPAGSRTATADDFPVVQSNADTPPVLKAQPEYQTKLRTPSEIVDADVLANNYIAKGWLDRRSDAVAFGEWNIGKTFVILDLLACVALGLPWFGARVRKSRVLYLCYEGHAGMPKRIRALQRKYPDLNGTAFAWWPMRHALASDKGKAELKDARRDFAVRFNGVPDLVAVDPLRNALGGSDSDADKVELLRAETRSLMEADGCAVLLVTHSGHGNKERVRGDSGITAGADSEIRIDGPEREGGPHTIVATKQRDSMKSAVYFRLRVVDLGTDDDGDPVSTCTVEAAAAPEPILSEPGPSVDQQVAEAETAMLRLLVREIQAGVEHSADSLKRLGPLHGLKRAIGEAAIARLEAKGRIEREATGRKGGRAYKLTIKGGIPNEGAASLF